MSATLTTHRLRAHMTTDDGEEQRVSRRAVPLFLAIVRCDVRARPMGGQGRVHGLPSVRAPVPASAPIGDGPS